MTAVDDGVRSIDGATRDAREVLDPVWLSETVGAIYDCVLEPHGWSGVLERIAVYFSFADAALAVLSSHPVVHQIRVQYGFDEEWLRLADSYADEFPELWGGLPRLNAYPLDEPIIHSEVMPRERLPSLRY